MTEPPDHLRCRCALVGESSNAAGSDEEINIEKLQAMLEVVRNSNPDGTWKRGTKKHMRLIQKDDHASTCATSTSHSEVEGKAAKHDI